MQRFDPPGGIGGVVEKPRFPVPGYDRLDQDRCLLRGLGRMAPGAPDQDAPQILGRAGIAPEIAERPSLEEFGPDFRDHSPLPTHHGFVIGYGRAATS